MGKEKKIMLHAAAPKMEGAEKIHDEGCHHDHQRRGIFVKTFYSVGTQ